MTQGNDPEAPPEANVTEPSTQPEAAEADAEAADALLAHAVRRQLKDVYEQAAAAAFARASEDEAAAAALKTAAEDEAAAAAPKTAAEDEAAAAALKTAAEDEAAAAALKTAAEDKAAAAALKTAAEDEAAAAALKTAAEDEAAAAALKTAAEAEKPAEAEAESPATPADAQAESPATPADTQAESPATPADAKAESPATPADTQADSPATPSETQADSPATPSDTQVTSELERTMTPKKEEPKEITWSSLSVATGDVQESLETAVQYTAMAQGLREKGLISRAIRMMERALMITQRSELEHPTLALEACKVRLVFAAYLSEGYRHREALRIIKEAQESLTRLMHWAVQCPEDMAVQAVGREARALHCSAVVAQAVASDLSEDPEDMDENLKETARLTTASMPPDHPLASLVRQNLGAKSDPRSTKRALREVT
ncbi:unnamed protein product, partial [Effrenium voratum]